ncbi:MAG: ABC transporter permease [Clostridia bacterium]|nr:ABC transporter permease [Clostridia bacterium]
MGYYILKRFFYSLLSLFIIITASFFMMHAMPGSVYTAEKKLPPAIEENIKAKYGLDKPLHEQYLLTLTNLAKLDFGMSMHNEGRGVNDIIEEHFPVSASLGTLSIVLVLLGGVPLGIVSAMNKGKWQDNVSMVIVTLGVTVPGFVVAALAQYFISVKLKLLPVMGFDTPKHWILPGVALSFFYMAFIARLIRSGMVEVLEQDYIRTARAKGLSKAVVVYKHALKNAVLPVIAFLGPLAAGILTGTFVIERVFSIPGLGRYFISSISNRDYTVIMGVTVFYAAFLLLMVFIVDIIYVIIDPRIKLKN